MKKVLRYLRNGLKLSRKPETYWGFPVGAKDSSANPKNGDSRQKGHETSRQKGIAILIAVMVFALMATFIPDLIVSAHVNSELAARQRDNLKSEYMAKSAVNLGILLLSVDYAIQKFTKAEEDSLASTWSMLNGFPIGGDTLELVGSLQEQFNLSSTLDEDTLARVRDFDGQFVLDVSDESGKINVNMCFTGFCTAGLYLMEQLFTCPAEKSFLEAKNIDGKELAARIKDYLDQKDKAEPTSGLGDEDEIYRQKNPSYLAKNAQLDSVEELMMVEGWDEEIHAVFSPYLTTFPFPAEEDRTSISTINVNLAPKELLLCLFRQPGGNAECFEKIVRRISQVQEEKGTLSDSGSVDEAINLLSCNQATPTSQSSGGAANGDNQKDPKDPKSWLDKKSKVFRVSANGEVGEQVKRLEVVIKRGFEDNKNAKVKRKSSYKILHWRLL